MPDRMTAVAVASRAAVARTHLHSVAGGREARADVCARICTRRISGRRARICTRRISGRSARICTRRISGRRARICTRRISWSERTHLHSIALRPRTVNRCDADASHPRGRGRPCPIKSTGNAHAFALEGSPTRRRPRFSGARIRSRPRPEFPAGSVTAVAPLGRERLSGTRMHASALARLQPGMTCGGFQARSVMALHEREIAAALATERRAVETDA